MLLWGMHRAGGSWRKISWREVSNRDPPGQPEGQVLTERRPLPSLSQSSEEPGACLAMTTYSDAPN